MAKKRAYEELFVHAAIRMVYEVGIENLRTKDVADLTSFSEATLFRFFPSKDILLRETFLYIDKEVSDLLTQCAYIRNPDNTPFELAVYAIWHKVYRYLLEHREETIFLIRYRYSSLYTDEVRSKRQAYNGGFDRAYAVFEKHLGTASHSYRGFIINYIFELTLCFAEKIITGKVEDTEATEGFIWTAVRNSMEEAGKQAQ